MMLKDNFVNSLANVNMLIRKFNFCSDAVKVCRFKSYSTNLYSTQFWYDSSETLMKKLCVGYNNSLRRLTKLDKHCSASELCLFTTAYLPLMNYKGNILQI